MANARAQYIGKKLEANWQNLHVSSEITRAYLRVSAGLLPNTLAFQDIDAWPAAALFKS